MTGPSSSVERTRAVGGVRRRRSKTTRTSGRSRKAPRAVSAGSSTRIVLLPTAIASTSARTRCAWRFDSSEVSGVRRPGADAIRPSRLVAAFRITNGRPSRISVKNGRFSAIAASAPTPTSTATPFARRNAKPRPRTAGFGSSTAATTRVTPASTMRLTQGPVRP